MVLIENIDSFSILTGMAALAKRFTVHEKREHAMRVALGGIALGLSFGPPFGGAAYQYLGKKSSFLILCGLTFIDGCKYLKFFFFHTLPSHSLKVIYRSSNDNYE